MAVFEKWMYSFNFGFTAPKKRILTRNRIFNTRAYVIGYR